MDAEQPPARSGGWRSSEARLSQLVARLAARGQLVGEPIRADVAEADPGLAEVRHDSRRVSPGDLFVARRGQHADGHDHVPEAVGRGAAAVIVEHPLPRLEVPQLVVRDARVSLAQAAAWRAGDPSRHLGVVGITGTDGKTTTAYLVRAILEAAGQPTGLVGTTDVIVGGRSLGNEARATTPEAPELQGHLADMLAAGDRFAVLEATSHGLAQERVGGVAFDVAALTNITSEHLEFHGTLAAYRQAKQRLFELLARGADNPDKGWAKHAIVNADDPQGKRMGDVARDVGAVVLAYGLAGSIAARAERAELGMPALTADGLTEDAAGMHVSVRTPSWEGRLDLRLAGRFNVANALAALGVAEALGLDMATAARALAELPSVPGRMQRIDAGQPFSVIIDYAHTEQALATVLDELAPPPPAGLIAVFGSAGERDLQKRPRMGRVAGERCRLVVITDEDPRREDRATILEAIAEGAEAAGKQRGRDLLLIPDRAEAIAAALGRARPGDVVVLAGKGHERSIEMDGEARPWDEAEVARTALVALGYGR